MSRRIAGEKGEGVIVNEGDALRIAQALSRVPQGSVQVDAPSGLAWAGEAAPRARGRGWIALRDVTPGVRLAAGLFQASQVHLRRREGEDVLEIHVCWSGRAGWNLRDGRSVYLGEGDVALHSCGMREDGVTQLPLGYGQGAVLWVNLKALAQGQGPLNRAGIDLEEAYRRFCAPGRPMQIPAGPELAALCGGLCQQLDASPSGALENQALALLLYLFRPQTKGQSAVQFRAQQTDLMREVHALLTASLDRRVTIEELSKQFFLNSSTLKAAFKAVYGQPIASYMKAYRIHKAMEMLRGTDESIASISFALGYETQGKFAKAFKSMVHMPPSQYRRTYRSESSALDPGQDSLSAQ